MQLAKSKLWTGYSLTKAHSNKLRRQTSGKTFQHWPQHLISQINSRQVSEDTGVLLHKSCCGSEMFQHSWCSLMLNCTLSKTTARCKTVIMFMLRAVLHMTKLRNFAYTTVRLMGTHCTTICGSSLFTKKLLTNRNP